jgi:hypothetical protein
MTPRTTIASRMNGNASWMSPSRISAESGQPRKKPAMAPVTKPSNAPIRTAAVLIASEVRAPYASRLATSRPSASVPSGWSLVPPSHTGGARLFSMSCSSGS